MVKESVIRVEIINGKLIITTDVKTDEKTAALCIDIVTRWAEQRKHTDTKIN